MTCKRYVLFPPFPSSPATHVQETARFLLARMRRVDVREARQRAYPALITQTQIVMRYPRA